MCQVEAKLPAQRAFLRDQPVRALEQRRGTLVGGVRYAGGAVLSASEESGWFR